MKVNDIIKTEAIDLNHQGQGVCKIDGFTLFVDSLLPGEVASVEITKLQKNFGYGRVKELLKTSKDRILSECPSFGSCGGCQLQHLHYDAELRFKVKMVEETIKRLGHLDLKVDEIIGMNKPYYYRNKVQIPFRKQDQKIVTGFFMKNSHQIVPLQECLIQPIYATKIAKWLRDFSEKYHLTPYDEKNNSGILRHVLIRKNKKDEYMVVLITRTETLPNQRELIQKMVKEFPFITSIYQNINEKATNVILGKKTKHLYGNEVLIEEVLGLKFLVSPNSFFQTNLKQTEKLYQLVKDMANPTKDNIILDAYCGVGTISLLLANSSKKVYGIEIVNEAIKNAKANMLLNGIDNVQFITGKAEEEIKKFVEKKIDIIIVDPPRKGCEKDLLEVIMEKRIPKLIYVSCNSATLARDLEILSRSYDIQEIKIVDMFPRTSDVECVCTLTLAKK